MLRLLLVVIGGVVLISILETALQIPVVPSWKWQIATVAHMLWGGWIALAIISMMVKESKPKAAILGRMRFVMRSK